MALEALPRTANGKVDRRALPAPDRVQPDRESPAATPRTPTEATLAEIWQQVLGIDQVGVEDGFFDLGGNSLSTIQVAFGIRRAFNVDLPLEGILTASTLRALAGEIDQRLLEHAGESTLAQLLEEVDQLSDHEAQTLAEEETRAVSSEPARDR